MPPPAQTAAAPPLRAKRRAARGSVVGEHSARVRLLRWALPALIGLLLLLVVGWLSGRALLAWLGPRAAPVTSIRMVNPKFYGRDSSGRAFTITATSAARDLFDANQVTMERPIFILQTGQPKPTVIQALTGLYREDTRNLILSGQVQLDDSAGFHFESERALIDTNTGVATGETAVVGTGPLGQIASSSYAIYDGGAHTVFKGAVRVHLNNASQPDKQR